MISESFKKWMRKAKDEDRESLFNFTIYTLCGLPLIDRFFVAFEILMGKKFSIRISRTEKD